MKRSPIKWMLGNLYGSFVNIKLQPIFLTQLYFVKQHITNNLLLNPYTLIPKSLNISNISGSKL